MKHGLRRATVRLSLALAAGLVPMLSSCRTTEKERTVETDDGAWVKPARVKQEKETEEPVAGVDYSRFGLAKVAGTWKFSGLGQPTISTSSLSAADDPVKHMSDMMDGAILTVGDDGRCTLAGDAPTQSFRLRVAQETEVAIQLGADGVGVPGRHFLYEKPNDRLVMPGELQTDTTTGMIPVYFRRAQ